MAHITGTYLYNFFQTDRYEGFTLTPVAGVLGQIVLLILLDRGIQPARYQNLQNSRILSLVDTGFNSA